MLVDFNKQATMAHHPSKKLRQTLKSIEGGGVVHEAVIADLFRQTRRIIEADKSGDQFPYAHLYCTWMQHISLTRHPAIWLIADRLDRLFFEEPYRSSPDVAVNISEAMGLADLRQNFRTVFAASGAPTHMLDSRDNWTKVASVLLEEIAEYPATLVLPKRPGPAIDQAHARMSARRAPHPPQFDRRIAHIEVVEKDADAGHDGAGIYIQFEQGPRPHNLRVASRILLTEPAENFLYQ